MSGAATWTETLPGVPPWPHARRWRAAFGALFAKELRDLAWLAGAVAAAAALLTFGAAAWFDFVLVSLAPAASPTWFGLAALASLPLAAEALCVDSRSGLTRRAQSWPTPRGAMLAAKAAALMVLAVLILGFLVAAALGSPGPRTMVAHDTLGTLIPRVAAVALFVTLITAAVTQHSLAALLLGLVSTVVLVVAQGGLFPPLGLAAARLELAVLQLLQRPAQNVALVVGALCVGWVHAARGPAARSVLRRAARAALCVGGLGVVHAGIGSHPWLAAPVGFDDPGARVSQLLPSPDGRRLVIELEHASPHALSWWLMDPLSEAPPQRLSTEAVASATGLGTSWQVRLLGWSQDGTQIVGASLHPRGRGENWTLDPDTLAVLPLEVGATGSLLGEGMQQERAPGFTSATPLVRWSLRGEGPSLTLPVTQILDHARGVRGLGFYADDERRVHRFDFGTGEDRATDVVLPAYHDDAEVSNDGRWLVLSRNNGLTLIELASGRSREIPSARHMGHELPLISLVRTRSSSWAFWTRRAEPLVVDVSDHMPGADFRCRVIGIDSERDLTLPVGATMPIDLDGEHWLVCDTDLGTLTLLAADGQPLRTLRAPREEAQP